MDRKAIGVADTIASLAIADDDLMTAATRLQQNREPKATPKTDAPTNRPKPSAMQTPDRQQDDQPKPAKSSTRAHKKTDAKEWGNPTAILNTRIPPELDQMIDDRLAKERRAWKENGQKGTKPTKQVIVQAALENYFNSKKT